MEQPRRASAPEGEGIRIVIDEVSDTLAHSHTHNHTQGTSTSSVDSLPATHHYHVTPVVAPLKVVSSSGTNQVNHQTSFQQRRRAQLTRATSIVTHYERVVVHRDETERSNRTRGFGVTVMGGKVNELDGMLYAYVSWIKPGGVLDGHGIKVGDKILEWNGKSLVNASYEQVCFMLDDDGGRSSVELLIESMVKW